MKTAVIVQARQTSTRLPGKVLLELNGRTVLSHVLERCQEIPGADVVCCAVPEGAEHDLVAREAKACGAVVTRGSLDDVLARYYDAAKELGADVIMRVTSDCPMIDPQLCGQVLSAVVSGDADYASNNMPPSYPHGLDCEAFTFDLLEQANQEAQSTFDREHVTTYIRTHSGVRTANIEGPGGDVIHHRWTLDTAQDLSFMEALFERLPEGAEGWNWQVPLSIVEADPVLDMLNQGQDVVDTRVMTQDKV